MRPTTVFSGYSENNYNFNVSTVRIEKTLLAQFRQMPVAFLVNGMRIKL